MRWPVDPGYPMLDDRDSANPGRGQYVVTWRATLPAGMVLGNVAESVEVWEGPAMVAREVLPLAVHKDPGQALLVYVNEHIAVG